jgi:serine/threonine protein kinase
MQHPNVVKLYGSFQDAQNIYMALEFIQGGEVFSHLRTLERFDLDVVRFYAAEILLVFEMMHRNNIVYRDLKPENLLFDQRGHIKFIDFGFAKKITDRTYTLCGTPEYFAPEVVKGEGAGVGSDWWSYGVLLYEMLVGQSPFYADNEAVMYQQICRGTIDWPDIIDPLTKSLLVGLLQVDVSNRLGCTATGPAELKQHPWFTGIDWSKLYHHKYQPPLLPVVESEGDSSNFADYSDPASLADVVSPDGYIGPDFEGF